jgi:hypothetical protein
LKVHGVNDIRQTEIHTTEPLVPEPSVLFELAIQKLKSLTSTSIDQIPSEMVKARGKTIRPEIHKIIILFRIRRNCLRIGRRRSLPMYNKGDKTDGSNYTGISLLSTTYVNKILLSSLCRGNYWGSSVWISTQNNRSTTDQIFRIRQILEKKWEYNEAVHRLFIDFKKAYDLVRGEVLYYILIEFGIPMKLVRLITMVQKEIYSTVQVGKHLSDMFPVRNGLKQDVLTAMLFNFYLGYAISRVQVNQDGLKFNGTH